MSLLIEKLNNLVKEFISEYNPQIVTMDVFSKDNLNQITYKLLIANNSYIIDYKIEFKSISIKLETTRSHQEYKKKNHSLILRKELINNVLKLEHKFVELNNYNKQKEPNNFSDAITLNKINDFFNDPINKLWNVTFQNIVYILLGSNPGGEGKGKGYLLTKYLNEHNVTFGFFLSSLNICKRFREKYCRDNRVNDQLFTSLIDDVYSYLDSQELMILNLNDFLKLNPDLDSFFKKFIKNPNDWKIIKKQIKDYLEHQNKKFLNINSEILKLRHDFVKQINKKWNNPYYDFFNIKEDVYIDFERAHIKPVFEIKNEYLQDPNNNKDILNQISDPYNFLPLTPDIHTLYDKYKIYWDYKTGKLKCLNSYHFLNDNSILLFKQLNDKILKMSRKYLKDYFEKIWKVKTIEYQ